jgi:hypothetical protein
MNAKRGGILDFGGYFPTLLYVVDSHFTFHNFFILYAPHVLDSGGLLYSCLCIPTGLTMWILIRSLQFSLCFGCMLSFSL